MKLSHSMIAVIAVVALVTGINIWMISREPEQVYETLTGYGLKFSYPEGMSYNEDNFGSKSASMESGFFQGMLSEDPLFVYVQVFWNSTDAYSSSEAFIDSFLERVEAGPDEVSGRGQTRYISKDGFNLAYAYFNVTDRGGVFFKGIIGSWRDGEMNRYYMITYLTTEAISDPGLAKHFENLLESVEIM